MTTQEKEQVFGMEVLSRNKPLYAIALLQGILLLAVYQAFEYQIWPYGDLPASYAIVAVLIIVPVMALLSIRPDNWLRATKLLAISAIALALMGLYVGSQELPKELTNNRNLYGLAFVFSITVFIAAFKATMYVQEWDGKQQLSYPALFSRSWRNMLSVVLAWIFVAVLRLILWLWSLLFEAIGIGFFRQLFDSVWFSIPVLVFAFGVAITVFRELESIIDGTARLLQALMKFLLPLLAVISLSFLITLPFTGFDALLEIEFTSGTALILWLQALLFFFANGVYQQAPEKRIYPDLLHRMIYLSIMLMPIYSIIAAYGLWQRIDEYGLTTERCWAVLVWLLLALFSVGYSTGVISRRDQWIESLGKVNVSMGLVVLASMILVNSPLLDFRKFSVASQLERLDNEEVSLDDFDYHTVGRKLGRPGYERLKELRERVAEERPDLLPKLDDPRPRLHRGQGGQISFEDFKSRLQLWPGNLQVSGETLRGFYTWYKATGQPNHHYRYPITETSHKLVYIDLNEDGESEYVFITNHRNQITAYIVIPKPKQWHSYKLITAGGASGFDSAFSEEDLVIEESVWKVLRIGKTKMTVLEEIPTDSADK